MSCVEDEVNEWTDYFLRADHNTQQRMVAAELLQLLAVAEDAIGKPLGDTAGLLRRAGPLMGEVRIITTSLRVAGLRDLHADAVSEMLDWWAVDELHGMGQPGSLIVSLCGVALCAVGVYRPELADTIIVMDLEGDRAPLPRETPEVLVRVLGEGPWQIACRVAGVDAESCLRRLSTVRLSVLRLAASSGDLAQIDGLYGSVFGA